MECTRSRGKIRVPKSRKYKANTGKRGRGTLQTEEEEAFDDTLTASCNHFNKRSNNEDDSEDELQQLQLHKHLLRP